MPPACLVPSATLLAAVTPLVDACPARQVLLLCRAALVGSIYFTQLLLNAI